MIAAAALLLLGSARLFDQSMERLLAERFADRLDYLVMRIDSGSIIAHRWPDQLRPAPVGSLLKPFLAASLDPLRGITCEPSRCWLASGHGTLRLSEALAHSCNSYFLQALERNPPSWETIAHYGLPWPESLTPSTLIGLGGGWLVSPKALAGAYAALVRSGMAPYIRSGLALAARSGTARQAGTLALAKTGTARCTGKLRCPGDGLAAALYPAANPEYVLLIRMHGTTGAAAAKHAGAMLQAIHAHH